MAKVGSFNTALTATYRMQFHKDFNFADAARRANYLRDLGVSHVYASPIMKATPGSMHGYDVTDFAIVNPELGGEDGFRRLARALREVGVGLIVDIVPNHMAVGGGDNPYWFDLLQNGRDSAYSDFFDVDFDAPGLNGKILLPVLGGPYAEVLASGDLAVKRCVDRDDFAVYYFDASFPLRSVDQQTIRAEGLATLNTPERLHQLLEAQHYRLANWRTANDLINYRRFFEITSLVGVRIERPEAFDRVHRVPLELYGEGVIDGVRVDHVDGLTDPAGYCQRLRAALEARKAQRPEGLRQDAYIVVEKILASDEKLAPWPIEGTTGYDFMNEVSALQHGPDGAAALLRYWRALSGRPADFDEEERIARSELLVRNFPGQLDSVIDLFHRLAAETDRDLTRGAMRRAIIAVVCHLRVYRSYALGGPDNPGMGSHLERAFEAALGEPSRDDQAILALRDLLNARGDSHTLAEAIRRLNQLTSPVAAKAVEDTAFYRYTPLLSRNDVGFDAARLSMPVDEFHRRMTNRAQEWPHAMLTTATHDHKRGEDVRARLAVLSEIPDVWVERCEIWSGMTAPLRGERIHRADEYALFQTIVGAWPFGLDPRDAGALNAFAVRLAEWMRKALREAKLRSSWLTPDLAYEEAAEQFVLASLNSKRSGDFLASVADFVASIASAGVANALTQTAIRCLAPGVPDLYRGCELWDLTLVDPDNRRPVDFDLRERLLSETSSERASGGIKQSLIRALLGLRRAEPALFAFADYRKIEIEAPTGVEVLAFERRHEGKSLVAALALRMGAILYRSERLTPPAEVWGEARLPIDLTQHRAASGAAKPARHPTLGEIFADSPVAVFIKS